MIGIGFEFKFEFGWSCALIYSARINIPKSRKAIHPHTHTHGTCPNTNMEVLLRMVDLSVPQYVFAVYHKL